MREIKFRMPIYNRNGKFIAWHYWGFIEQSWGTVFVGIPIDPATAQELSQQYTGLHDKWGVEIYAGDLIKDSDSNYIGQVIFDEESLCFTIKFQNNELWGFVPRQGKDNHCEVIGNIYEEH